MGDGLQQFLPFGWIIDLGEFLRQVQVIPADDAILDIDIYSRPGASGPSRHAESNKLFKPTERRLALRSRYTRIYSAIRC